MDKAANLLRLRSRVIDCAAVWAEFQEPDSLADQATDHALRVAATDAADALRRASDEYGMAQAAYQRSREINS
jgi:hypothetical protein